MKMFPRIGYPRYTPPGGMPVYSRVSMGDAKGSKGTVGGQGLAEHEIVTGYGADGRGGNLIWSNYFEIYPQRPIQKQDPLFPSGSDHMKWLLTIGQYHNSSWYTASQTVLLRNG